MNRLFAGILSLVCLLGLSAPAWTPSPPRRFPARFAGTALPQPPRQEARWTPPRTSLPATLVSATAALFDQGLADPRGCDYRVVEVTTGFLWDGKGQTARTHAWVPPAGEGEQPFAVCWNGLVYPAVSVGDRAHLNADVLAAIGADAKTLAEQARWNQGSYRYQHAPSEGFSTSYDGLLPLKCSLLLRLGEEDLARRVWGAWVAGMDERCNDDAVHLEDPYLMLATQWAWALFDRAVCAHMRGDDGLALASARALVPVRDRIEREAEARGFRRPDYFDDTRRNQKCPYLGFLEPLPLLLADQERRARIHPRAQPSLARTRRLPNQAERVRALIGILDLVDARQSGQPGGVNVTDSPIVQALVAEGEDAISPLLGCLEKDARLTRSVGFGRDFHYDRYPIGVHVAARKALEGILETTFDSPQDPQDLPPLERRRRVAARIRTFWRGLKGASREERWYRALANAGARRDLWVVAAAHIIARVCYAAGVGAGRHASAWSLTESRRRSGRPDRLSGEVLRTGHRPSVSTLMARRTEQMASAPDSGLAQACDMALCLAEWDPAAAAPVLRAQMRRYLAAMPPPARVGAGWDSGGLDVRLARLALARARVKDRSGLAEYLSRLECLPTEAVEEAFAADDLWRPLWEYPDDPHVRRASEHLFSHSPWVPLLRKKALEGSCAGRNLLLIRTPLLGLPAFRREVLRGLADRSPAGTVTVGEGDAVEFHDAAGKANGGGSGLGEPGLDPFRPKRSTVEPMRACDRYAWELSHIGVFPTCAPYWPEGKRDAAVAACAAILRRYGDRLRTPDRRGPDRGWPKDGRPSFAFPPLTAPATTADVRRGRAIFSLSGKDPVRVCRLPRLPARAEWVTNKQHPFRTEQYDAETSRSTPVIAYRQSGTVWQAEEVLRGGRWQRYYGFVGCHGLHQVPAEQVEFPKWPDLSGGRECRVTPPGVARSEQASSRPALPLGRPLLVTVWLRNAGGLPRGMPTEFLRRRPNAPPSLRAGVQMHLFHAVGKTPDYSVDYADGEGGWEEMPSREPATFTPGRGERVLDASESMPAFQGDLRDWFAVTQPGLYRLYVTWEKDSGVGEGLSNEVLFTLEP